MKISIRRWECHLCLLNLRMKKPLMSSHTDLKRLETGCHHKTNKRYCFFYLFIYSKTSQKRKDTGSVLDRALADPRGTADAPTPPSPVHFFSFSCTFSEKMVKIISWLPHLRDCHPLHVYEILHAPLHNLQNK